MNRARRGCPGRRHRSHVPAGGSRRRVAKAGGNSATFAAQTRAHPRHRGWAWPHSFSLASFPSPAPGSWPRRRPLGAASAPRYRARTHERDKRRHTGGQQQPSRRPSSGLFAALRIQIVSHCVRLTAAARPWCDRITASAPATPTSLRPRSTPRSMRRGDHRPQPPEPANSYPAPLRLGRGSLNLPERSTGPHRGAGTSLPAVGLLGHVSIADRPRQALQQLRSEVLAVEVSGADPLAEHHGVGRPVGHHDDPRHTISFVLNVYTFLPLRSRGDASSPSGARQSEWLTDPINPVPCATAEFSMRSAPPTISNLSSQPFTSWIGGRDPLKHMLHHVLCLGLLVIWG
jgi:hypothetical protein